MERALIFNHYSQILEINIILDNEKLSTHDSHTVSQQVTNKLQKNAQTSSKQIIIVTQKDQHIKLTRIYHFPSTKRKSITID